MQAYDEEDMNQPRHNDTVGENGIDQQLDANHEVEHNFMNDEHNTNPVDDKKETFIK